MFARSLPMAAVLLALASGSAPYAQDAARQAVLGAARWQGIELTFDNPTYEGNPFQTVSFEAVATTPSGTKLTVPGFYDGDGKGGQRGHVWKLRVMTSEAGRWQVLTRSNDPDLDGVERQFAVTNSDARGLVMRDPEHPHSMKFANGERFFEVGPDDPEAFLAEHYGPLERRLSQIDYLADKGMNVFYLGYNYPGDGGPSCRVEPFLGDRGDPDWTRIDLADMREWEAVFARMQERGIVIHFVLELDDSRTPPDQDFYYREMIARFGWHPNLIWNLAEEYTERHDANWARERARYLKEHDPWGHMVTVHPNSTDRFAFAGDRLFDLTAMQYNTTDPDKLNALAIKLRRDTRKAGWPIPISVTEWTRLSPGQLEEARKGIWAMAMGGATSQIFNKNGSDDVRDWDAHWDAARHLHDFMLGIDHYELAPDNSVVSSGYCLRGDGLYALYLPEGGTTGLDLRGETGPFSVKWLQPQSGRWQEAEPITGGGVRTLTAPGQGDWAVVVRARQ